MADLGRKRPCLSLQVRSRKSRTSSQAIGEIRREEIEWDAVPHAARSLDHLSPGLAPRAVLGKAAGGHDDALGDDQPGSRSFLGACIDFARFSSRPC